MVDLNKSANPESQPEKISQWLEEHGDLLYRFASSIARLFTEGYKIITLQKCALNNYPRIKNVKKYFAFGLFQISVWRWDTKKGLYDRACSWDNPDLN